MFNRKNFKPNGYRYKNTPSQYGYTTEDNISTVATTGYFSNNRGDIKQGDFVFCKCSDGAALMCFIDENSIEILSNVVSMTTVNADNTQYNGAWAIPNNIHNGEWF